MACAALCLMAESNEKAAAEEVNIKEEILMPIPPKIAAMRDRLLRPESVVADMKIRDGMVILDLGAGNGAMTFPIADALHGTGHVYATDLDPKRIKLINEIAAKRGMKNITAVLVKQDPLDNFYSRHTFDIILLCDVLSAIWDIESLFRNLKPSLSEDGYLYVIEYRQPNEFHREEIGDYDRIFRSLSKKDRSDPLTKRMGDSLLSFLSRFKTRDAIPDKAKDDLIERLNASLSDNTLFPDIVDHYCVKNNDLIQTPNGPARKVSIWSVDLLLKIPRSYHAYFLDLYVKLDEADVFTKNPDAISKEELELLREFNKLLLMIFIDMDLSGYAHIYYGTPVPFRTKKSMLSKLERAGFVLANEYNISPYFFFLELKHKSGTAFRPYKR